MTDWTPIAVISGLVLNACIVAFGYGGMAQRVRNLEAQSNKSEKTARENRTELSDKIDHESHIVLPECQTAFLDLGKGQSEIKGRLDLLVTMILQDRKKGE